MISHLLSHKLIFVSNLINFYLLFYFVTFGRLVSLSFIYYHKKPKIHSLEAHRHERRLYLDSLHQKYILLMNAQEVTVELYFQWIRRKYILPFFFYFYFLLVDSCFYYLSISLYVYFYFIITGIHPTQDIYWLILCHLSLRKKKK